MEENENISTDEDGNVLHEHHRITVDPKQSQLRIDKFLQNRLEGATRSRIQKAVKDNSILVNGEHVKSNYKVRPHDVIVIALAREPHARGFAGAEEMDLDIRYEDEHLIVLYKPAGLVVHPGVGNYTGTLVNGLVHYLKKQKDIPVMAGNDATRPGLVHRIDKDTTGLMLVAKTELAMTHLAKQFYNHTIDREYRALVWGSFSEEKGTIDACIGRHPKNRLKRFVFVDGDEGKSAVTHYEVIEDLYYVSLVKCKLETGRTHQIRVHMAHKGHALFNDVKYGGDSIIKGTVFSKYKQFVHNVFKLIPRHALHAASIGFIHPATKDYMKFDAELPEDMQQALEKWRHYVTHQKSKQ